MSTPFRRVRKILTLEWLLLTSALLTASASGIGCAASESHGATYAEEDGQSKVAVGEAARTRFVSNLVARANAHCQCSPLSPSRLSDAAAATCVAEQAAQLLEESLGDVTIGGPRPALDTAQVEDISEYLKSNHVQVPGAGRCELERWLAAVVEASANRPRSRGTLITQRVFRVDRRHPNAWSDAGFMAASTNPELTASAAPYDHYGASSMGSQVWVSVAKDVTGIWAVLRNHLNDLKAPTVCLMYNGYTNTFRAATELEYRAEGRPGRIPLQVSYIYESGPSEKLYGPTNHPIPEEREALSLGFRPIKYKGVVVLASDTKVMNFTQDFSIKYTNTRCLARDRPPYLDDGTPFDTLRQDVVTDKPDQTCSLSAAQCARCASLTTPPSDCRAN